MFRRTLVLKRVPVARLAWALLLVAHGPAWVHVFQEMVNGGMDLARLGLLTVTQLLFVLKITDVPWLRLPSGWRARFALLAIVVLLHAGVLDQSQVLLEAPWQTVAVSALISSALLVGAAWLTTRHVRAMSHARWLCQLTRFENGLLPGRFLALVTQAHRGPPR